MALRNFIGGLFRYQARIGDVSDRLNSTWTFLLLLVVASVAYYENKSNPITCWCPAEFQTSHVQYTNDACWDTEYVIEPIPPSIPRQEPDIDIWRMKYKWLPLILVVQALLFKLPDVVYSCGHRLFGINFQKILGLADGYTQLNVNDRGKVSKQVGKYLKNWLESSTVKGIPWGPLTLLYLFVKTLYLVNVVAQYSVLDSYLRAENETSYAQQLADDITNNVTSDWRQEGQVFSRIVLCSYDIRQLHNLRRYTVQCYVNVATFYESLYGLLSVWLLATIVITSVNLGLFGLRILIPVFRRRYVKLYLALSEDEISGPLQDHVVADFAGNVTEDGVYILKAMGEVSSELLVKDVIVQLWNNKYHPQHVAPSAPNVHTYGSGSAGTVIAPSQPPYPPPQGSYQPQSGGGAVGQDIGHVTDSKTPL